MMKKALALFLALFLIAAPAWAAPTFVDADAASGGNIDGTLTLSFDATGADFLLACVTNNDSGTVSQSGVTFNGVSLTAVPSGSINNTGNNFRTALYGLVAPAAGAHDAIATFSDIVNARLILMSFTGVDPKTPYGTVATNPVDGADSLATINVSSAADEFVADCARVEDDTQTII
jgi:hypothetical protein